MSYLGKISALVTVNTGDFGPKLNACARDVRTFAQVVQREIGSSMRDANKAFEGIYTPLQRFERAMRAASSAKLSFVGLPGAIRTVDELQKRLGTLNDRQISVVLKASGMRTLDDFRASIQGLTAKNLNILAKVGGLDELKQLREQMVGGAGAVELDLRTGEAKARLKSLEAELAQARQAANGIPVTMKVDAAALERMSARMEALTQRKGLLEDARQKEPFGGSQRADRLGRIIDAIDDKIEAIGKKSFAAQAIADIDRLTNEVETARIEVSALQEQFEKKVGKDVASGLGIRSIDDAIAALGGLGISGEAARKVIDALLKSDGDAFVGTMRQTRSAVESIFKPLSATQEQIAKLAPEVQNGFLPALRRVQSSAELLKRTIEEGVTPVADTARQYDVVLARVKAVQAAAERVAEAYAMASKAKTGNELMFAAPEFAGTLGKTQAVGDAAAKLSPQVIAANPGIVSSLVEINSLTNKAVAAYARLQANIANKMPTTGPESRFQAALAELQALQAQAQKDIQVHIDAAEADEALKRLEKRTQAINDDLTFKITAQFQNGDQIEKQLASLMSDIDKLQGRANGQLGYRANDARRQLLTSLPVIQAGMAPGATQSDRDKAAGAIEYVRSDVEGLGRQADAIEKTDEEAKKLKETLKGIAGVAFPNDPLDALRSSAQKARSEVEKVKDATKRAALESRLQAVAPSIEVANTPAEQQRLASELEKIGSDAKVEVKAELDDTKLKALGDKWRAALTGKPQGVEDADAALTSLFGKIEKLDSGQRQQFAGAIANLLRLRAAATTSATAMMQLADEIEKVDSGATSAAGIKKLEDKLADLSKNVTTQALAAELASASAAGVEPSDSLKRRVETASNTGRDPNDPLRQLDRSESRIKALKDQIANLDTPLRSQVLPDIQALNAEIDKLSSAGASATASDIENLDKKITAAEVKAKRLNVAMNFRVKFDESGLNQMLNAKFVKGFEAQLEILANTLTKLTGKAAGEGRTAFLKLSEAIQQALDNDQIADPQVRKSLEKITQETAKTIGGLKGSGTSAGRLAQQVKRAGDVGRGGFDNLSLAVNQAAFAIDDFMSSTGGIEFKLRAVSNNITQMAFVLGGTKGLFIGLAAVIGGQALVGLMKFANGGQAAEDRAKALNDALGKQKSIVDELARAYGELGKQLTRGTLSSGAETALEAANSMKAAADAMRQISQEAIAAMSAASGERPGVAFSNSILASKNVGNEQRGVTGVLAERAQQESLKKRIAASENQGEVAALRQQLEESRKRERAAAGRATAQLTPDATTIRSAANSAERNLRGRALGLSTAPGGSRLEDLPIDIPARVSRALLDFGGQSGGIAGRRRSFDMTQMLSPEGITANIGSVFGITQSRQQQSLSAAEGVQAALAGMREGPFTSARESQINAAQQAIKALTPLTQQKNFFVFSSGMAVEAQKATAEFQQLIELIRRDLRTGLSAAIENTINSFQAAASDISSAHEQVAEAIRRGVPGARLLQQQLNGLGAELAGAYQAIVEASDQASATGTGDNTGPARSEQARRDSVARAESRVAEVRNRIRGMEQQIVQASVGGPFGAERGSEAISRLRGSAGAAIESTRLTPALQAAIAQETIARARATNAASNEAAIRKQLAEQDAKYAAEEDSIVRLRILAERGEIQARLRSASVLAESASRQEEEAAQRTEAVAKIAEFVAALQDAASRARAFADSALQAATRTADALRQAAMESPERRDLVGRSELAEMQLIQDKARIRQAKANLDADVSAVALTDPRLVAIREERNRIEEQQRQAAREAAIGGVDDVEQERVRQSRLIELDRQQETIVSELTQARTRELRAIESGVAARQREAEKALARDREEPTVDRARRQIEANMQLAEQRLGEEQQRFASAPTDANRLRRDQAEAEVSSSRRRMQGLQDGLDRKRALLEASDPAVVDARRQLAEITAAKAAEQERAAKERTPVNEALMAGLDELERQQRSRLDAAMAAGTIAERSRIDAESQRQQILARNEAGRRLALTERQRFREDMETGVGADIRARAAVLAKQRRNGDATADPEGFMARALSEQMKAVAPMLEEFRMERETAMLQGPSRAALQVSDVTTTQGQAELNRLLRGDDASKDVNLAELQKQSGLFQELINVVRNNPLPILP